MRCQECVNLNVIIIRWLGMMKLNEDRRPCNELLVDAIVVMHGSLGTVYGWLERCVFCYHAISTEEKQTCLSYSNCTNVSLVLHNSYSDCMLTLYMYM